MILLFNEDLNCIGMLEYHTKKETKKALFKELSGVGRTIAMMVEPDELDLNTLYTFGIRPSALHPGPSLESVLKRIKR